MAGTDRNMWKIKEYETPHSHGRREEEREEKSQYSTLKTGCSFNVYTEEGETCDSSND